MPASIFQGSNLSQANIRCIHNVVDLKRTKNFNGNDKTGLSLGGRRGASYQETAKKGQEMWVLEMDAGGKADP